MEKFTAYLRTPLYTLDGEDDHLPSGVSSLSGKGTIGDGGVTVQAKSYRDSRGRELKGKAVTLFIPMGKIDHLVSD